LGGGEMEHEVNAATDGNAKLSRREEEGSKVVSEDCRYDGADNPSPGSANADRA
jgi:hypothetical protein